MSRLTFTKEFMEQEELGGCLYVKPELLKVWDEKLRKYEDLGEPEELAKVVRCGECEHYRIHKDLTSGSCIYINVSIWSNHFCSYGRKKEGANE